MDLSTATLHHPDTCSALATLGHELKTPLVALVGFAQLLESDRHPPLTPSQRERAQEIEAAGRAMLQIVNDAINRSRSRSTRAARTCPFTG